MSESDSLPPGQVCANDDCGIDQRWEGFRGLACPECGTRLVVACAKCNSGATEEVRSTPYCPDHVPEGSMDGKTTGMQRDLLVTLAETGKTNGRSLGDILERRYVEKIGNGRLYHNGLRPLEERGLVSKSTNPLDARENLYSLTEEGEELVDEIRSLACPDGNANEMATDGGNITAAESVRITEEAREEHDVCPECGDEYIDLDTTLAGSLVFIHAEEPLETCTPEMEEER